MRKNNRIMPIISQMDIRLENVQESQENPTLSEPTVQDDTPSEKKSERGYPDYKVGILSQLFYWWLLPLYWKGYKKKINKDDISDVKHKVTCKFLVFRLEKSWANEILEAVTGISRGPQFVRALFKAFGPSLIILIIARLITDSCLVGQALLLGKIIKHPDGPIGLLYSSSLCILSALYLLLHQGWTTMAATAGLKIRVSCSCLLLTKTMKLNMRVVDEETRDLLTSVTKELELFEQLAVYLPYVMVGPIVGIIVTCILWDLLGATCLVGMIFLLLLIPLQVFTGKRISKLTMLAGPFKEKRVRLVKEMAAGIVQIKQCAWEHLFQKRIQRLRRKEAKLLRKATFFHVLISLAHAQGTKVMTLLSVSTFILLGNGYTVQKAFITICAIQALRIPLCLYFPLGISVASKVMAIIEKIQKILLLNEYSGENQRTHHECPIYSRLILMDACAKWDINSAQFTLKNLNLGVRQGELLAVAGPQGAGKTSLLLMLLGELPICAGKVTVNGHCVYCPQKGWIFPASLQKNITCGRPYREDHYKKVMKICGLDEESSYFPNDDLTIIGEGGMKLSHVQEAKVNLARAVYQDADIYLIDNTLATMTLAMATEIFNKCILGYLKAKTVLLVTDRPRFLQKADQILILKDGKMEGCGSYSILKSHGLELHRYVEYDKHGELDQEENDEDDDGDGNNRRASTKQTLEVPQPDPAEIYSYCRKGSSEPSSSSIHSSVLKLDINSNLGDIYLPINSLKIIKKYITAGVTKKIYIFTVFGLIIHLVLVIFWDYLYLIWTVNVDKNFHMTNEWLPEVNAEKHYYLIALWCQIGFTLSVGSLTFFVAVHIVTTASTTAHDNLLVSMLYAPLRCLNSVTLERILNAFSHDMKILDEMLTPTLLEFTQYTVAIAGSIVVIMLVSQWLLIPTIVLLICTCIVGYFCLPSTRALKKIEVTLLTSVDSQFKGALEGITVIRSLKAQEFFQKEYASSYDCHSSALYLLKCAVHALGLWMGLFSVLYTACITLGYRMLIPDLKPAHLGLATYCSLVLTSLVPEAVTYCAYAATQLASAGRMLELSKLEQEELDIPSSPTNQDKTNEMPPAGWPQKGEIEAKHLTLQYSQDKPYVLQNLNFSIKSREKVGVVGCVGAGKSALISALLRMTEPQSTEAVWIDDVNISSIPLRLLRGKISVVPRYPVLFSGQLRLNLDPDSTLTDNVLWDALDKVQLCKAVQALPYGLQTESYDWNKVFTIYQRQLLCLARAFIDGNRILLLDMAMGNLDSQMEVGMLQIMRRYFTNCTVIIVSHRLRSIMKTDRVLVLESGKMAESGHPYLLLQNEYSQFYKMVHQTGSVVKNQLIQLAREAYLGSVTLDEADED